MQTAIPALKQKYTRYEYQVIFDYLSDSIDKQINLKITHSAQNISI